MEAMNIGFNEPGWRIASEHGQLNVSDKYY